MSEHLTKEEAIAYLTRDGGRVPCSRYGTDSEECAPVAYALAEIIADANGEPTTTDLLDSLMGLVVNDSDEVAALLWEHGTAEHMEELDIPTFAGAMVKARELGREVGEAMASWVDFDDETAKSFIRGAVDDIDPMVIDGYGWPNLSGEYADDPTPRSLWVEITGEESEPETEELQAALGDLCDAWEEASYTAAHDALAQKAFETIGLGDDYEEAFIAGYFECGIWADLWEYREDESGDMSLESVDTEIGAYTLSNFSAEDQANIREDCRGFIGGSWEELLEIRAILIESGYEEGQGVEEYAAAQSGHDFWLTRNRHGAGFWDRGYGEVGDRLTKACRPYGGCSFLLGESGTVEYLKE